jgi:hypothetical protein
MPQLLYCRGKSPWYPLDSTALDTRVRNIYVEDATIYIRFLTKIIMAVKMSRSLVTHIQVISNTGTNTLHLSRFYLYQLALESNIGII